jgi:transcriptional regulator with XRE-family HTH domain
MTQADLARKVGISQQSIAAIERGRRKTLSWQTVARISKVLGVDPDVLFPVDHLETEVFGR